MRLDADRKVIIFKVFNDFHLQSTPLVEGEVIRVNARFWISHQRTQAGLQTLQTENYPRSSA